MPRVMIWEPAQYSFGLCQLFGVLYLVYVPVSLTELQEWLCGHLNIFTISCKSWTPLIHLFGKNSRGCNLIKKKEFGPATELLVEAAVSVE